ncbi:ABC transporter substrate-binding protein [Lipingzhangella sp. LS1_29]|uniref:ABC transporter substrate-binding protein n=1 Tax=Lipingzhangella rawalii TaxID=2055835 RepID=A0ABU2H2T7_9ACTN|nr:ABC transporter substrate-binding protein [Lipingzhangella rawalii]MDS1269184.1 ABC transporter substrate-binding protein [Lipingzhangella rawalii]
MPRGHTDSVAPSPPGWARPRLAATAAAGLAVTLLATGCGTDADETGDATLSVGVAGGSASDTIDGHIAVDNTDIARTFALYDTLTEFSDDFTVQMALAESVEPNEDATEWTVTLREDLHFSDGEPITADDVAFSMERIIDPDDPKTGATALDGLNPEEIEVVDERTVTLGFDDGFVHLPEILAEYYNAIVPEGYDPDEPVSSGPFAYESFEPGERSVFVRNEHYWREDQPQIEELEIVNFPDDTSRVNALIGGQVDVISQVPHAQIDTIASDTDLEILESETGMWLPFTMRVDREPFDDVRVRQAFRLIVDREEMVEQALSGYGTVANDLYSPYDPAYAEDIPQREQDIDEARELLAEAGYEDDLTVELVTGPINTGAVESAQVFAEQAAEAGVTVELREVTSEEFYGDNYLEWDFAQDFWGTRNYMSQAAQGTMPDAPFNETHWDHEEWTELVEEAKGTVDDEERAELLRAAQEIEHEEGGLIVWGFVNLVDAHHSDVQGFEESATGHPLTSYGFHRVQIDGS